MTSQYNFKGGVCERGEERIKVQEARKVPKRLVTVGRVPTEYAAILCFIDPVDDESPTGGSDDSNLVDGDVVQIDVEEEKKKDANLNEFDFRFGGIPEGAYRAHVSFSSRPSRTRRVY